MQLPHGIENRRRRIEIRAEAIVMGAHWAEQPDASDINEGEKEEIEEARRLAEKWQRAAADPAPYNPDCPACLRGRPHDRAEHETALSRVREASL